MGDIWHSWTGLPCAPVTLQTQRDAYQTSWLLEDRILNSAIIWKLFFYYSGVQTQDVLQMVQYSKKNKWVVHIYMFIFSHFCSKSGRHLRLSHTKMVIDGSGHNTQMFGYLYPMVYLHYQNSGDYNRGCNIRDHSCQHCKVNIRWQNSVQCNFVATVINMCCMDLNWE
jgi:hypothetical protein